MEHTTTTLCLWHPPNLPPTHIHAPNKAQNLIPRHHHPFFFLAPPKPAPTQIHAPNEAQNPIPTHSVSGNLPTRPDPHPRPHQSPEPNPPSTTTHSVSGTPHKPAQPTFTLPPKLRTQSPGTTHHPFCFSEPMQLTDPSLTRFAQVPPSILFLRTHAAYGLGSTPAQKPIPGRLRCALRVRAVR